VLNKDKVEQIKDDEDERPIEEIIEEERMALKYDDCTPVTFDTFMAWKKKKAE